MAYKVAVVGATGNVGHEMMNILHERNFPVSDLIPLASERSALPAGQIATHPAVFPFAMKMSMAELRRCSRFAVDRQGVDLDLVRLAAPQGIQDPR